MPLLQTTTAEGALKGMILGRASHELNDQEAAYLQDILVSQPGFLDRRGAIQGGTSLGNNFNGKRPCAIGACYDPAGNYRILVCYWDVISGGNFLVVGAVYDSTFTFLGNVTWGDGGTSGGGPGPGELETGYGAAAGPILLTPSLDGGLLVSAAIDYSSGLLNSVSNTVRNSVVGHWMGGYSSILSRTAQSATLTLTTTADSVSITGTAGEIAKLKPGIFVQGHGVIKRILTTTTAEFAAPSRETSEGWPGSGTAQTKTIRAFDNVTPIRTRGRISAVIGGSTVTGYGTRFFEMEYPDTVLGTVHDVFWILVEPQSGKLQARMAAGGVITTMTSDTVLTNATILQNMSMASFHLYEKGYLYNNVISNKDNIYASHYKGFITWAHKGYQFYSNAAENDYAPIVATGGLKGNGRTWIAGPSMHNEFDHARDDGDFFDIPPGANGADQKVYAGLNDVICTADAAYAIRGNDPSDFYIEKILDDGCISCTSITSWKGNTIWLGKKGIWAFDGVNAPVNLVGDSMGLEWNKRLLAFQTEDNITNKDAGTYPMNRAYVCVYRDTLFVNVQNTGSTHTIYTDGVARTVNPMQLMIYLPNKAMSFLTNFNFVGFLDNVPGNQQEGYAVLIQDSSTTHYLYPMSKIFTQGVAATDAILTANSTLPSGTSLGPWFHVESRKFDAGDGLWRKNWKQLAIESSMTTAKQIWLETVNGLNTTGVRALLPFVGIGAFKAARVKFRARDQYVSFRLYEDIANRPSTLRLGAWQWGYKFARRGSV